MPYRLALPLCLVLATAMAGCRPAPSLIPPPTPKVTVSRPLAREVTDYEDFSGRTDAVGNVDIRARVTGYLIKVDFQEGDVVEKDTLLYQIDARPVPGRPRPGQGPDRAAGGREETAGDPGRPLPQACGKGRGQPAATRSVHGAAGGKHRRLEGRPGPSRHGRSEPRVHSRHRPDHRQDQPHADHRGEPGHRRYYAADHDPLGRSDVRLLRHRGADHAADPEDGPRGRHPGEEHPRRHTWPWDWPTTSSGSFPFTGRSTSSTTRSIRRPARSRSAASSPIPTRPGDRRR